MTWQQRIGALTYPETEEQWLQRVSALIDADESLILGTHTRPAPPDTRPYGPGGVISHTEA